MDSPAGSHQGRQMDVSSGDEAPRETMHATHKKKHLSEDEMEALLAAKGASKAQEWLDSGLKGFKVLSIYNQGLFNHIGYCIALVLATLPANDLFPPRL